MSAINCACPWPLLEPSPTPCVPAIGPPAPPHLACPRQACGPYLDGAIDAAGRQEGQVGVGGDAVDDMAVPFKCSHERSWATQSKGRCLSEQPSACLGNTEHGWCESRRGRQLGREGRGRGEGGMADPELSITCSELTPPSSLWASAPATSLYPAPLPSHTQRPYLHSAPLPLTHTAALPVSRSHIKILPSSLPAATSRSPGPTKVQSLTVRTLQWPR